MKILYHLTILPPKIPQAEALSQEIAALGTRFDSELIYLNPNRRAIGVIPRLLFGWHRLPAIRRREKTVDLHHFYNPDPFPFPILLRMGRPVIYSITSGVASSNVRAGYFNRLAAVTVPDQRSAALLAAAGVTNCRVIRPGIDTARFTFTPGPDDGLFRLMVGSAPWTEAQFAAKGVDALLAAAAREPRLHLVFLWRGVLAEGLARRIAQVGVAEQVTVIDRLADVNQVLAGVHAAVTLGASAGIVKSYPHSLLDSLAAGKPVLVSRAIPMADYVAETGCGVVVDDLSAEDVLAGVAALREGYDNFQSAARLRGQTDFRRETMLDAYAALYQALANPHPRQ